MSIPEVVREIVTRNRSIYDCMKMDLINYTALAVKIQPEIEKILGNSVNLNTVVVAIKRYADSFEIKEEMKEESVLKNARLAEIEASKSVQVQQIKSAEKSWKDEYLTLIFTAVLVAHFVPQAQEHMLKGWELLSKAPSEFWWVILTIVSGSFGMNIMDKFKK